MIDLYCWPTSNGHKISIALEEMSLEYNLMPINIGKGDQFQDHFLENTPNHRIPAIVDSHGPEGKPYSLFESGAILIYLANKTGMFFSKNEAARYRCLEWLMFQMGGVGPMFGQANHFIVYAPEKIQYAIDRYRNEARRPYHVLDKRLGEAEYLGGEYSIADMAAYPWCRNFERYGLDIVTVPNVKRWLNAVGSRPAVQTGVEVLSESRRAKPITDEVREVMFGVTQYQRR